MPTLLIKDVFVVKSDTERVLTDIFIEDGRIVSLKHASYNADKVIDGSGLIALPGMIDCHVHCRDPGFTQKEDFHTASMAAAAGGVTTILDMPNTNPQTTTLAALEEKRSLAAAKCVVNYGFHFGTDGKNIDEIRRAKNIASLKAYMDHTTGEMMLSDRNMLLDAFCAAPRVMVHAEGDNVRLAIGLAQAAKKGLHCAHISTKEEMEILKDARRKLGKGDNPITLEVTPHHLFLSEEDHKDGFTKMKPPLASKKDIAALWQGIADGTIDTIGSDHAPHTKREKKKTKNKDESKIPYGVPGLETTLPLLCDAANKRRISLKKIIELTAQNPARIFGIKNKGRIEADYDADIVLVDMSLEKSVRNDRLFTKCKWSPFAGMSLKGWPVYTIVGGRIVFEKGKVDEQTRGREADF